MKLFILIARRCSPRYPEVLLRVSNPLEISMGYLALNQLNQKRNDGDILSPRVVGCSLISSNFQYWCFDVSKHRLLEVDTQLVD